MSLHADLLAQAAYLASREPRKPKQASIRRAVSAAYYALFHLLTDEAARLIFSDDAQVAILKRVPSHTQVNKVSKGVSNGALPEGYKNLQVAVPPELRNVAKAVVDLQQARHDADYDLARFFARGEALALIAQVEQAFHDWKLIRKDACSRIYLACLLSNNRN